jgi:hypothetical protein
MVGERTPTEEQRKAAIEHIRTTGQYDSLDDLLRQADVYARTIAVADDAGIIGQLRNGS